MSGAERSSACSVRKNGVFPTAERFQISEAGEYGERSGAQLSVLREEKRSFSDRRAFSDKEE